MSFVPTGPYKLYYNNVPIAQEREKMSEVKKVIHQVSRIAKQKDKQQALRDLDEIEKSIGYCKKILLREIYKDKKDERTKLLTEKKDELYG